MSSIRTAWTPSNSKTDTFSLKSPLSKRAAPCGAALLLFSDKPRRTVRRTALLLYSSSIRIGITKKQAMVETAAPCAASRSSAPYSAAATTVTVTTGMAASMTKTLRASPVTSRSEQANRTMPGARTKRKSSMRTAFRSSRRLRRPMS